MTFRENFGVSWTVLLGLVMVRVLASAVVACAGIADPGIGVVVRIGVGEGAAIRAVVPLSTLAFWLEVGGFFRLQFPGVNQLLSELGPIQISSCAYKADDPAKRNFSVIATDKHLPHSERIINSAEHFTIRPFNRFLPATATLAFRLSGLSPLFHVMVCAKERCTFVVMAKY